MTDDLRLAAEQLARMRGMTYAYHARFFADVRFTAAIGLLLGVAGYAVDRALFLAVPFVALLGASQTAFDASYLIFARQYAARLEGFLREQTGAPLVAADLEAVYLFPLERRKVVTVPVGGPFTWFGFMTILYTMLGGLAAVAGLWLGWDSLAAGSPKWVYVGALTSLTMASLTVGGWWFGSGAGEQRLAGVLDRAFPGALPTHGGETPSAGAE